MLLGYFLINCLSLRWPKLFRLLTIKMQMRLIDSLICFSAHICLLSCILPTTLSQRLREPSRANAASNTGQTFQWQHNGQIFRILSHGSEYQPPRQRQNKDHSEVKPITIVSNVNSANSPSSSSRSPNPVPGGGRTSGLRWLTQTQRRNRGPTGSPHHLINRNDTSQHPANRNDTSGNDTSRAEQDQARRTPPLSNLRRVDGMVGDDPYNPYKSTDPDNPYYNYYDTYERPRRRQQRPGYGTRYYQHGKNPALFEWPYGNASDLSIVKFMVISRHAWKPLYAHSPQACLTSCQIRIISKRPRTSKGCPCITLDAQPRKTAWQGTERTEKLKGLPLESCGYTVQYIYFNGKYADNGTITHKLCKCILQKVYRLLWHYF